MGGYLGDFFGGFAGGAADQLNSYILQQRALEADELKRARDKKDLEDRLRLEQRLREEFEKTRFARWAYDPISGYKTALNSSEEPIPGRSPVQMTAAEIDALKTQTLINEGNRAKAQSEINALGIATPENLKEDRDLKRRGEEAKIASERAQQGMAAAQANYYNAQAGALPSRAEKTKAETEMKAEEAREKFINRRALELWVEETGGADITTQSVPPARFRQRAEQEYEMSKLDGKAVTSAAERLRQRQISLGLIR